MAGHIFLFGTLTHIGPSLAEIILEAAPFTPAMSVFDRETDINDIYPNVQPAYPRLSDKSSPRKLYKI